MDEAILKARVRAQRAMTPPKGQGFNVVGVDTFEEPGEELYLIANVATREEAERKAASYRKQHPEEIVHIYGEPGDTKKSLVRSDLRKHVDDKLVYLAPGTRKTRLEW